MSACRWLLALALLFTLQPVSAAPLGPRDLPRELLPWIPWVLYDVGESRCTSVGDEKVCVWPTELELDVGDRGGAFRLRVTTERETTVALPGSASAWPEQVQVSGEPAVVRESGDAPALLLPPGSHLVTGRFDWTRLPKTLAVDPAVATLRLRVGGKLVAFPKREESGQLWLEGGGGAEEEPERLELEVFRKLEDGVPLVVTTRLDLRVAGRARELNLGHALLPGTTVLGLAAPLPTRLDDQGNLVVQLLPGSHEIGIRARAATPPASLEAPRLPTPWPEREIWVFVPDPKLRQVELSGGTPIDPGRTNLPEDWKTLRAFSIAPAERLVLTTVRRGEPSPPPNRIEVTRELWLDSGGGGYTVRDQLSGTLARDWRLELPAGELGRVVVDGQPQLITLGSTGAGVELRRKSLNLVADWRINDARRSVPAVGWAADAEKLKTTLHLPPGWELFGASGVDRTSGTWLDRWNLLDAMWILGTALLAWRLFGRAAGLVALCGLTLSNGLGAPRALWLGALVLVWLGRAVRDERLRRGLGIAQFVWSVGLCIVLVDFATTQLRRAFFPTAPTAPLVLPLFKPPLGSSEEREVEPDAFAGGTGRRVKMTVGEPASEPRLARAAAQRESMEFGMIGLVADAPGNAPRARMGSDPRAPSVDPKAVIQTGPGIPDWSWRSWELGWDGRVSRQQQCRLWLISPLGGQLLALLRTGLLVLLGAMLWRGHGKRLARGAGVVGAVAAVLLWPGLARAEIPGQELRDELKARLTAAPECQPNCVTVPKLDVRVVGAELELVAEVHAAGPSSYQLPGPAASWVFRSLAVDGKPGGAVAAWKDGFLHLRLEPGRHVVELTGPIAGSELALTPGTVPKRVVVAAPGWQVHGVAEDGTVEGSVHLVRELAPAERDARPSAELPPWLGLDRVLSAGVTWTLQSTLRRVSPKGTPVVVRLPLLEGEQVTEPGILVENQQVVLSLERDAESVAWTSVLRPVPRLELVAPQDKPWTETWKLYPSTLWHCRTSGVVPSQSDGDTFAPVFHPWPGEKLSLSFERPAPAPGRSITIEAASLLLVPTRRSTEATLNLELKSSSGGTQVVTVPEDAELVSLTVGGQSRPIQRDGRAVRIQLAPAQERIVLSFRQAVGIGPRLVVPEVNVGGQAVNARVKLQLPPDRLPLVTSGAATWGPAVLFWPYLGLLLLGALLCSRLRSCPLRAWQWALFALGLTQAPALTVLVLASWFCLLSARARWSTRRAWLHDAMQMGVALWTLVAGYCLVGTVYHLLLGRPDLLVRSPSPEASMLVWYADRIDGNLPAPWLVSIPIWAWRGWTLAWALWLGYTLFGVSRWAVRVSSTGGWWRAANVFQWPACKQHVAGGSGATE